MYKRQGLQGFHHRRNHRCCLRCDYSAAEAGDCADGGLLVALCLNGIEHFACDRRAVLFDALVDDLAAVSYTHLDVYKRQRQDLEMVYAGDISAAVGLKNTTTGDTLCDEKHPLLRHSI